MSEDIKKVAELEAQLAAVTKKNEELEAAAKKVKADLETATKAKDAAEKDEVLKVGDTEVKKSAVGAATFAVLKAQEARIAKAEADAEIVTLTKRAEADYGYLPGEPVAKAKVLKGMAGMDEEARKALDVMLKAGDAALKSQMREIGMSGAGNGEDDPVVKFDAVVKKYASEHQVSIAKAQDAISATPEGQALYAEARAEQRARARAA